ncbi:uncharacterized protein LOC135370186 isoform X2 [Ornithodoros turicata]|uniref:uncharacterized protein LOC135370186 isoform X2 n=1 Tax=Ornithodoros turicata TaxID=34597 RepID=UPI00313A2D25
MKILACLVITLYISESCAAKLPKKIQFGTYVLYDTSLRERSTTGIGVYTKLLINSINARLPFNVTETKIQLVLVGIREVLDSAIIKILGPYQPVSLSDTTESLLSYVKNHRDQDIKKADIVLYITGQHVSAIQWMGKYYRGWSRAGAVCTPDKGVALPLYNPDFDKMESVMFGILRLLGSHETGGVAANLKTKSAECLTKKKPRGVYSNVTKLPGEGLDGTAYCKEFADNLDEFSLCETLDDGCTLSCCWNQTKDEYQRTSAPDGYACGSKSKQTTTVEHLQTAKDTPRLTYDLRTIPLQSPWTQYAEGQRMNS